MGLFKKKNNHKIDFELPLAPLASFFTVVLVFLIQSTNTRVNTFDPTDGMELPTLSVGDDFNESLRFQVSANAIKVNDKPIYAMKENHVIPAEDWKGIQENLAKALTEERPESMTPESSEKKTKQNLVLMADKKTPFEILKKIFSVASENGYLNLRLVIVKE